MLYSLNILQYEQETVDGDISFKKARFQYPTRPEVNVLRELNLSLTSGQKIALVGPSGCGKSTCIQLLQRFYDLKAGDVVSYYQSYITSSADDITNVYLPLSPL